MIWLENFIARRVKNRPTRLHPLNSTRSKFFWDPFTGPSVGWHWPDPLPSNQIKSDRKTWGDRGGWNRDRFKICKMVPPTSRKKFTLSGTSNLNKKKRPTIQRFGENIPPRYFFGVIEKCLKEVGDQRSGCPSPNTMLHSAQELQGKPIEIMDPSQFSNH